MVKNILFAVTITFVMCYCKGISNNEEMNFLPAFHKGKVKVDTLNYSYSFINDSIKTIHATGTKTSILFIEDKQTLIIGDSSSFDLQKIKVMNDSMSIDDISYDFSNAEVMLLTYNKRDYTIIRLEVVGATGRAASFYHYFIYDVNNGGLYHYISFSLFNNEDNKHLNDINSDGKLDFLEIKYSSYSESTNYYVDVYDMESGKLIKERYLTIEETDNENGGYKYTKP